LKTTDPEMLKTKKEEAPNLGRPPNQRSETRKSENKTTNALLALGKTKKKRGRKYGDFPTLVARG